MCYWFFVHHLSASSLQSAAKLHEFMCTRATLQPLHDYSNVFNLPPKLEEFSVSDFNTCVMVNFFFFFIAYFVL